ncbi:MAG: hypothetical protein RID25_23330 [Cyclobacteriaceae bacterium]
MKRFILKHITEYEQRNGESRPILLMYCEGIEDLRSTIICLGNKRMIVPNDETIIRRLKRGMSYIELDFSEDKGGSFMIWEVYKAFDVSYEVEIRREGYAYKVKYLNIDESHLDVFKL